MYSAVLMVALVGGGDVANGHGDCYGGCFGCYGGCYGGGHHGGCRGGHGFFGGGGHHGGCRGGHGFFGGGHGHHRGHGCHGGCFGGCFGDCYGGFAYGCNGCYGGYGGCFGGCYGGFGYGCYGSGYGCYGGCFGGGYGGCFGGGYAGCYGGGYAGCDGGCYGGGVVVGGAGHGGVVVGGATGVAPGGATGATGGGAGMTGGRNDDLTPGTELNAEEKKWLKEMVDDEKDPKEKKKIEDDFKKANRVERKATYDVWKKMKSGGDEAQLTPAPAMLIVRLPAEARLTVDGEATTSTSARRVFSSPPLAPGKKYSYTLKAEFLKDGETVSVIKRVNVRNGALIRVNLEPTAEAVASK
jgi:uncharacterized protein (TIGR03000 family)